jgi:hypothetical protein
MSTVWMATVSAAHNRLIHVLLLEGWIIVALGAERLGLATLHMVDDEFKVVNRAGELGIGLDRAPLGKGIGDLAVLTVQALGARVDVSQVPGTIAAP